LYDYVNTRLIKNKKNYIFIDEIQNIQHFQKAANGLFINKNVDLYLTGSNSKMQSGEWATLLSGRYVEIQMFPLSFKEYVSVCSNNLSKDELYSRYLGFSSFPWIVNLMNSNIIENQSNVFNYLSGIYNTIVLKDVVENKKINEIGRLERVIKFMADNIGSETSIKRISDMLKSDGLKILPLTVESYLDALRDSYILYRADRYDVKGRKLLKTLNKYYLVNMGLRRYILGSRNTDTGHILENIVYLELLRRGYRVYIGKVDEKEVDFVAEGPDGTIYFQVSETVRDKNTLNRELSPLNMIRDYNPKFLLTRDYEIQISYNGIKQLNVLEWLLK